MYKIFIKVLAVILLFQTLLFAKHKMYINILDIDNTISFENYYTSKLKNKFKYKDVFIAFDGQNMQYISSIIFDRDDVTEYKKKRIFINKFEHGLLRRYEKQLDKNLNILIQEGLLSNEKNDFSRQLKVLSKIVNVSQEEYDIKVIFFGNTYLHNAYKHNFSEGIPTDGFIFMKESEFNTFDDINASEVKFGIMFDDEPRVDKNRLFRFYKKLFRKKFNYNLTTFNDSATFGAEKNINYDKKDFKKDRISVLSEKKTSDCSEHDNISAIYVEKKAIIQITIENICRKDSLVSFYHNGVAKQIVLDKYGKGNIKFEALIGDNFIEYYNLNSDKKRIFQQNIVSPSNDIEFIPDNATALVEIKGYNPLRKNDTQVEIYYKTTGSYIRMDVKDGHYSVTVPVKVGEDNLFEWKDLNGKKHSKIIRINERCTDKVEINSKRAEEYGIGVVTLFNECREDGSQAVFLYNDQKYISMIKKGKAVDTIILEKDINDIYYEDFNKKIKKLATIKIKDFKDLIRFIISYHDNVIALMNIFEPNINLDSTKIIKAIDYNDSTQFKMGHLHDDNPKSKYGEIIVSEIPYPKNYLSDKFIKEYKQIYITRRSKQVKGNLYLYVDYFSRHGNYGTLASLCGKRSLGGIIINYQILNKGIIEKSKKFLNPSRCKKDIEDGKLKHKLEDENLIFIKKVEIK